MSPVFSDHFHVVKCHQRKSHPVVVRPAPQRGRIWVCFSHGCVRFRSVRVRPDGLVQRRVHAARRAVRVQEQRHRAQVRPVRAGTLRLRAAGLLP